MKTLLWFFFSLRRSPAALSLWLLLLIGDYHNESIFVVTAFPSPRVSGIQNHHRLIQQHHLPLTTTTTRTKRATCTRTTLFAVPPSPLLDQSLLFNTWEWCANLGSPAALVAGAVLATLIDGRESLAPVQTDTYGTRLLKKWCRFLLLSSFGLEVISIFVTTVTGTMLLSMGDVMSVKVAPVNTNFITPIGFLMHNFEFEFLTARICFLQGLFNWLASVAFEILIPKSGESKSVRYMNRFISSSLVTIIIGMLSFLNSHLYFYVNYGNMLRRYAVVCFQKYFCPPTVMSFVLIPAVLITIIFGIQAFMSPPMDDGQPESACAAA
jgi:hypothetical protein